MKTIFAAALIAGIVVIGAPAPARAVIGGACCTSQGCTEGTQAFCEKQLRGSYRGDSTTCKTPNICSECGNEQTEPPTEQCDDGNTIDTDGCINCRDAFCGDGFQFINVEQCDDGNTNDDDECASCRVVVATTTTQPPTTTFPPTTTTSTTTTTLSVSGACCYPSGGCNELTPEICQFKVGGAYQGDHTTCDDPGICSTCGNGEVEQGEECDDGDSSSGDGCSDDCAVEQCWTCTTNGGSTTSTLIVGSRISNPSVCEHDDSASCDDGDVCTLGDTCSAGTCGGEAVLIPAACEWVMVGGDPTRSVQSRYRGNSTVIGDVCGDTVRIGDSTSLTGDAVAVSATGRGVFIAAAAVIDGDVVTGGSSVVGKPRGTVLPGLATDEVASGQTAMQSGDATDVYDTTGSSARVDECEDAQADVDGGAALVAALPSTQDLGDVLVKGNQSLTINATNIGGLNVVDFDRLRTGNDATITLDGGGSGDTVFILRVRKKLDVRFRSDIVLANGTTPGHVIIVGSSRCKFGEEVTGGGTVVCPDGKLLLEERVEWMGAVLGGRKIVQLRDSGVLTHAPLQVGQ
ncbi:MAG TPA: DUF4215 domain-containing protein [Candidatus Limnocylindrales bacterium]|nr:DUF4215 domain-containing protein [Candidatus Limnocylindrales bacterium]